MPIMKYIVFKKSFNCSYIQLLQKLGKRVEIIRFDTQEEFAEFIKDEQINVCLFNFSIPLGDVEEHQCLPEQNYDNLFVRQGEYFKKILFSNMKWVEASRSYCYIHTSDDKRIILTHSLSEMKKKLPPALFIQPHRSYLLNVNYVNKYIGNTLYIDNQSFPISRKFKKETLSRFLFLDNIKNVPEENTDESEI